MTEARARRARVEELLVAARTLADPTTSQSARLRARLTQTTELSRASVDFALENCLEQRASESELHALLTRAPLAARALVLLSANVFVAPLRAIAIARAASAQVVVRASRRDPALTEALAELLPHAFELRTELEPAAGDHLWAYGSNETLRQVGAKLPSGVVLHAHGSGLGAVVVDYRAGLLAPDEDARAIALDAALFDQRGCLSPRVVCVLGSEDSARALTEALARELALLGARLPPGAESPEQLAERRRFLDAATYAFEVTAAGQGFVSLCLAGRVVVPPAGRNLHVARVTDAATALAELATHLTCVAISGPPSLKQQLAAAFPGARRCELGHMQRPPLDGPVDLRSF